MLEKLIQPQGQARQNAINNLKVELKVTGNTAL
jgi:hypothetical protein